MADLKDAAGKSDLTVVGKAIVGMKLEGKDLQESLACGNDGVVAQFDGGYLNAAQGADGGLNLTSTEFTISARLRAPSGAWEMPLLSKHGGHERLIYNLHLLSSEIGFELGTQGNTVPSLIGAESVGGNIKTGWNGQIDHVAIWKRALSDSEIERLSGGAKRIAAIKIAYAKEPQLLPPAADLYQEKYRPQFHVTARQWTGRKLNPGMKEEGWINDVNGLIYHQGQYHLFAQRRRPSNCPATWEQISTQPNPGATSRASRVGEFKSPGCVTANTRKCPSTSICHSPAT